VLKHYNDVPKALRAYDSSKLSSALQQMYHGDDATISSVLTNLDGRLTQAARLSEVEISELVAVTVKALTDPSAVTDLLIPAGVRAGCRPGVIHFTSRPGCVRRPSRFREQPTRSWRRRHDTSVVTPTTTSMNRYARKLSARPL